MQQYLEAPMCLSYLIPSNEFVPIAIQIKQLPGPQNPIFFPTDSKYDWLLAKIYVRHADTQVHQLVSHLLNTHLFAEVYCIVTLRKLPSAHPVFKVLSDALPVYCTEQGSLAGVRSIAGSRQSSISSTAAHFHCFRGTIWDLVHRFVANIVDIYYKSNASVQEDEEIHEWAKEIFTEGFLAKQYSGFPTSFSTKDDLIKYLTMVIFSCSAQHSAVNAGQFDWGSWVRNNPSTMQKPAPTEKGKVTEEDILNTLLMKSASVLVLATIHLLSQPSPSKTRLGTYMEQCFIEQRAKECIEKFQEALMKIENEIKKRNEGLDLKYTYLIPRVIENSVAM
ncbi:hydroperoxide isomerase ALOXE3-like [Mobula hypostoma]|uniref:hydroperoxide isomerase ALOXE3-like n=1 Tax=Mobula hypostoma TaxID=723540 RepID=UPI002FC37D11